MHIFKFYYNYSNFKCWNEILFNSPIKSAEEIATICFIWSVFVGGASCYRKKMHMGIDILTQTLPKKFKNYVELLINIIVMLMNGLFSV